VSEGGSEKQRGLLLSASTRGISSPTHVGRWLVSDVGAVGTGAAVRSAQC
jgi:hypothetical protein